MRGIFGAVLCGLLFAGAAWAGCPVADDTIVTDRPTVANSSSVVPMGSLQLENGIQVSRGQGATTTDLPETRTRLGLGGCTELLVDWPDYTHAAVTHGVDGTTNIGPAVKHQFQDLPDGLTLSGTVGSFLNTGDKSIAGRGPAPYVQMPWSYDLGDGWSANGMFSETFYPREANSNPDQQTSIYMDKTVGEKSDLFVEFINDYKLGTGPLNRIDVGGSYRCTPTHQIDLKVGAGLNGASPDWYVTLGYSFRFDQLF